MKNMPLGKPFKRPDRRKKLVELRKNKTAKILKEWSDLGRPVMQKHLSGIAKNLGKNINREELERSIKAMEPILKKQNEFKLQAGKAIRSAITAGTDPTSFQSQLNNIKVATDTIDEIVAKGKMRLKAK